jgi:hypothetical protein
MASEKYVKMAKTMRRQNIITRVHSHYNIKQTTTDDIVTVVVLKLLPAGGIQVGRFHHSADELFALLGFFSAYLDICLPEFRDSLSITTSIHCVPTQMTAEITIFNIQRS